MSTIIFDMRKFAERLEKAGVTREQAALMAGAQGKAFAEVLEAEPATATDVTRIENRIEQLELRLTMTLGTMMVVAVGVVVALVKVL